MAKEGRGRCRGDHDFGGRCARALAQGAVRRFPGGEAAAVPGLAEKEAAPGEL